MASPESYIRARESSSSQRRTAFKRCRARARINSRDMNNSVSRKISDSYVDTVACAYHDQTVDDSAQIQQGNPIFGKRWDELTNEQKSGLTRFVRALLEIDLKLTGQS